LIGQSLLHYEITAKLGEGGMGEVYRAKDGRLGRDVAVKVLPEMFVADPERLARFEREAQLLAALNHPNIGAIYGLEEANDKRFLVLELIDGETLGERLAGGSMPVEDALGLARQIAEALQVAHARGIVHRDLKPANIKITPQGQVKVLDFGLAKAWDQPNEADLSLSPTLTAQMTQAGVILGTASYMSPEQARAQDVDKRADIWSFGIVLFEMLAGGRIFPGNTVTDILGAIVHKEPDWDRLPPNLASGVRRLLRRCLEKDRDQRLQDIGDARIEIEEAIEGGGIEETVASAGPRAGALRWLPWAVATVAAALAVWATMSRQSPTPSTLVFDEPKKVSLIFPESQRLNYEGQVAAVSPDGRSVAYCAESGGETSLYLRRLDSRDSTLVEDTQGCHHAFFSADGEWVGMVLGRELFKVRLSGGTPVRITSAGGSAVGASWGDDDAIVFAGAWGAGLARVPAAGGERELLTTPDLESGDSAHIFPEVLPGSKTVLYTAWSPAQGGHTRIMALATNSGESRMLLENARVPRYSETGHLLFMRGDHLMAVTFDPDAVETLGPPFVLATNIRLYSDSYGAVFDVSDEGTLVYQGGGRWEQRRSLMWVDRNGESSPAIEDRRDFTTPDLSPDGDRILVTVRGSVFSIWVYDLAAGTRTKLPQEADNGGAVWLASGVDIAYWSNKDGPYGVFTRSLDGDSSESPGSFPPEGDVGSLAASPDGRHLMFTNRSSGRESLLALVELSEGGEPTFFRREQNNKEAPAFSPDGRWVAFVSDETGDSEVHVAPFPGPGANLMISSGGGGEPRWSRDGRELYYVRGQQLFAVQVDLGDQVRVGDTELLIESDWPIDGYAVAADGRFLMVERVEEEGAERHQLNVVLNWPAIH